MDWTVLGDELQPGELGETGEGVGGELQVQVGVLHQVVLLLLEIVS